MPFTQTIFGAIKKVFVRSPYTITYENAANPPPPPPITAYNLINYQGKRYANYKGFHYIDLK